MYSFTHSHLQHYTDVSCAHPHAPATLLQIKILVLTEKTFEGIPAWLWIFRSRRLLPAAGIQPQTVQPTKPTELTRFPIQIYIYIKYRQAVQESIHANFSRQRRNTTAILSSVGKPTHSSHSPTLSLWAPSIFLSPPSTLPRALSTLLRPLIHFATR